MNKPTIPPQRYELRAEIIRAGFRSYREFSKKIELDAAYLSRVLNGYMWPSAKVQRLLSKELGISLRELRGML